jgi:fatty acid desaturase
VQTSVSRFEQFSVQHYAREVRALLPPAVFEPVPTRLLWLPVHLSVIVGFGLYVALASPPWYLALGCALAAGHSWACLGFLAHEVLHHAVVKSRRVERIVGSIALSIFCLSPTLWNAWHNQSHHGNTGDPDADPDGLGTWSSWQHNAVERAMEEASPGSGRKRSAAFLFVTFSVHSAVVLLVRSHRENYYARISRRAVYAETAAVVGLWIVLLLLVGPWKFLFIGVLPALIANGVTMSYIATNHFLSSLTSVNDPLVNSLSVRAPTWLERLHLQFGYHVEHHIFPTVNGRHLSAVREMVRRLYGQRYLSLPHGTALRLLYTRPKIHLGADRLIDPRTRQTFNTLAPGDLSMAAAGPMDTPG